MENREQEAPVDVSQAKLAEKLNEFEAVGEKGIAEIDKYYKITGSPSNNAIIVQILICATASACTALINSLSPIKWLISLIPVFNLLNLLIYSIFLAFLQFGSPFFKKGPWNFLFFSIHFVGKTSFMIFYGVNYPTSKFEVFFFICIFGYLYVLNLVRNKDAGMNGVDLTVRANFFQLTGLGIFFGVFLVQFYVMKTLLTGSGFGPMLWQPIVATLYFYYLLLEAQRFEGSLEYLKEGKNALFLGAAQIDADLVWFCPLAWFHVSKKGENLKAEALDQMNKEVEETAKLINPEV